MCKANVDIQKGISNGSVGIIVDFINSKLPKVRFDNGVEYVFKKEYKSDNFPEICVLQFPTISMGNNDTQITRMYFR